MDTAQYLRPLLSNQAQNFTIWAHLDILYIILKIEVTWPPWRPMEANVTLIIWHHLNICNYSYACRHCSQYMSDLLFCFIWYCHIVDVCGHPSYHCVLFGGVILLMFVAIGHPSYHCAESVWLQVVLLTSHQQLCDVSTASQLFPPQVIGWQQRDISRSCKYQPAHHLSSYS